MARRSLIRTSTEEWRAIAKGPNVLYHVCTTPEKQGGWDEEDFYACGRQDWAQFLSQWQHYAPEVGGHVLEIGCGAGRMTAALVGFFDAVDSIDVSEDMIARARARVGDKASFHQVSGSTIPLADASVDAVFTVHVMQHLDDHDAIQGYLNEAYRVLRPGGTVMAHIMIGAGTAPLAKRLRWGLNLAKSRLALTRGKEHTAVRMVLPNAVDAIYMVRGAGFADVELRAFDVHSTGGIHSFFLGRKLG